jgi:hypothetical protein
MRLGPNPNGIDNVKFVVLVIGPLFGQHWNVFETNAQ